MEGFVRGVLEESTVTHTTGETRARTYVLQTLTHSAPHCVTVSWLTASLTGIPSSRQFVIIKPVVNSDLAAVDNSLCTFRTVHDQSVHRRLLPSSSHYLSLEIASAISSINANICFSFPLHRFINPFITSESDSFLLKYISNETAILYIKPFTIFFCIIFTNIMSFPTVPLTLTVYILHQHSISKL